VLIEEAKVGMKVYQDIPGDGRYTAEVKAIDAGSKTLLLGNVVGPQGLIPGEFIVYPDTMFPMEEITAVAPVVKKVTPGHYPTKCGRCGHGVYMGFRAVEHEPGVGCAS
jgi:hypothetical protein